LRTWSSQHLVTLATVQAVRTQQGLQDIDIRIKWPNDIYYGSQVKLGGVIAKSSFLGIQLSVTIGAGINLDNSLPTNSVNDIIRSQGREVLKQEILLAETFNQLEYLMCECNEGNMAGVLELYYKFWLHHNQRVKITTEQKTDKRDVTVIGIDEFGFLQVKDTDGEIFSVTCDGNSFDMMSRLRRKEKGDYSRCLC
jgi:biotin--protein ligase